MLTEPDAARAGEESAARERGTRVLVADDSALARRMIVEHLRSAGFSVDEARNGAEALRQLERGAFDVVLTDLQMPEADGFAVLEAVKQRSYGAEVIILTGTHAQDVSCAIRALRLGAHDFLTKPPSSPDEIVLTVERAAEKKRLRETNLRLLRELQQLSRTDSLTGAYNRRMFDEAVQSEAARCERYDFPLSLILLDLDHFKATNDRYGHQAGDCVLQGFARIARAGLRASDGMYRYGGEEFAVLLPHTPIQGGLDAGRRIVTATAAADFETSVARIRTTVSAGVACVRGAGAKAAALVAAADDALYAAKRGGRNRVEAAAARAAGRRRG
jgi:diguanylate cyclase (GGDEF)-like protein